MKTYSWSIVNDCLYVLQTFYVPLKVLQHICLQLCTGWLEACWPFFLLSKHLFVYVSRICRPARVWHSKEPRSKRVPGKNALLLRGESSGTATVAMAPMDVVQLSLWLGAVLPSCSKWEVADKRQKDFYQRQVWGQRGESVWFMGPDLLFSRSLPLWFNKLRCAYLLDCDPACIVVYHAWCVVFSLLILERHILHLKDIF